MKYKSVFDIIGPITIGTPSANGVEATKIGHIVRQLFLKTPEKIEISLYGAFKKTDCTFGLDVALVGGILGLEMDDSLFSRALTIATERGITVNCIEEIAKPSYPNTVKITLYKGEDKIEMIACSVGWGKIKVIEINGFDLNLNETRSALLIMNNDHFGTISSVTSILAIRKININMIRVSQKEKGKISLLVIETEELLNHEVIEEIKGLPKIYQTLVLS
ncbi:L-serine dehydratase, iron-sulfur-dependent, beta subunit (plasmid) [Bacillus pseudomycoides]|uniref:L-serine ammonia-lyase, iron-sulfur-dependent subunit beta n=1 Tax=Bacillus pseudomycoides TaxID=64104 RepID=UPI0004ED7485|nr:L-serine ammonia-lyase, iron-sulfur-dependent subunit beta [Bacillus pseudomycoides]AIK35379.1 L-serine dehydratase, iron-sulfur-dependent, beta subunit [Bacillus pseudomycoides]AJI14620.1 L-serine dehydratase, iron-sulfur-dependent, beta subunit [Bacillus pseudomycoides]